MTEAEIIFAICVYPWVLSAVVCGIWEMIENAAMKKSKSQKRKDKRV